MKKIKLDKLSNIIIREVDSLSSFIGMEIEKRTDINGTEYELKKSEEKYHFFNKLGDSSIFVSETHLLNVLLKEHIDNIETRNIYEHGYPESRLIPSNHHEECQVCHREQVLEDITEKIVDILNEHYYY